MFFQSVVSGSAGQQLLLFTTWSLDSIQHAVVVPVCFSSVSKLGHRDTVHTQCPLVMTFANSISSLGQKRRKKVAIWWSVSIRERSSSHVPASSLVTQTQVPSTDREPGAESINDDAIYEKADNMIVTVIKPDQCPSVGSLGRDSPHSVTQ